MRNWLSRFCEITGVILFCCFIVMTLVMNSLVVTRYFFSFSPSWTEELTRYVMVWLVMLGGAVLVLFDDHIALHLLFERLGSRARLFQMILIRTIIAVISAVTAWTGYGFAQSMWSVTAPGLGIPMFWPTLAVPVSMTLIFIFAVLLILRDLGTLLTGTPAFEVPNQSDFMDGSFKPAEENGEGDSDVH